MLPDTDKMLSWVAGEQLVGAAERAHGALRLTLAGDGFGDSTGSGRLVQLFFLRSTVRSDAPSRSA